MGGEEDKSDLEELKKDYSVIREKYNLPSFKELNNDFQIEKLADTETDCLVREIRKMITDKFANYLRFVEAFLHPNNAPMFVLSLVKLVNFDDKKLLVNLYEKLAKNEMKVVELDLYFIEEKEAKFVKNSYESWQIMKKDLLSFTKKLEDNWDNKPIVNGKGYFG